MAEQPINQPHVGWSPDYKSVASPMHNRQFIDAATQLNRGINEALANHTMLQFNQPYTVVELAVITQLKSDLQMAKDAYAGAKREAMLEHARILGRAVKAEIELEAAKTQIEKLTLKLEIERAAREGFEKGVTDGAKSLIKEAKL